MKTSNSSRRLARVAAVSVPLSATLLAAPTFADVPEGWTNPAPVDGLHALLVLGAIPLGVFLVVSLLALAPSLIRGEKLSGRPADAEWFGGSGKSLDAHEPAGEIETGGASGRW